MISSSVPREGKTTLAVSVAAYCASVGRRVLLVDLDFRHPSISRTLGGKRLNTGGGIIDVLQQDLPPPDAIQHLPGSNLHYLPIARGGIDPLVLFGGERLPRLIRFLREHYDCVILDGPPLLGFAEVPLLASLADQVLFAVKWSSTRREVARSALDLLRGAACFQNEANANSKTGAVPAAIVTHVNLRKHARYQYGDVAEAIVKYRKYYSEIA
jgi:Mrp family chromosome partitioning ATPase